MSPDHVSVLGYLASSIRTWRMSLEVSKCVSCSDTGKYVGTSERILFQSLMTDDDPDCVS